MASCKVTTDIELSCADKRRVGGVKERAWRFSSKSGFTPVYDVNGYITGITFQPYEGLVKVEGPDNSHSGGYTIVNQNGVKFFQHDVTFRTLATNPADMATLEDHLVGDGPIILETNNQEFVVYGIESGMKQSEGNQNTGNEFASDTANVLTFVGASRTAPKFVLSTDYATTLALLEGYEL
jgi:hypothetical protein